MTWVLFVFRLIVALAVLGVALGLVRPKTPRGGYTLAAAAGVDLLMTCCVRGVYATLSSGSATMDGDLIDLLSMSGSCFGLLHTLLTGALVIAALALAAREAAPPKQP